MPAHSQTSTAAIVAAGRRLLEERGIDALTMREVAEAIILSEEIKRAQAKGASA